MRTTDIECCEATVIHEEEIHKVLGRMPAEESLNELADFYKAFADATRVKILCILQEAEVCVCDLAVILGVTQSAVSHQLRMLKQMKLVKSRRDGKTVFYSLADDHIKLIIKQGMEHIME